MTAQFTEPKENALGVLAILTFGYDYDMEKGEGGNGLSWFPVADRRQPPLHRLREQLPLFVGQYLFNHTLLQKLRARSIGF
jgi:hypothetical protein